MPAPPQIAPLWLPVFLALASGCITTKVHSSSPAPAPAVTAAANGAWEVKAATGSVLGFVVRFQENAAHEDTARAFFSVRNIYLQELGLVDGLGRSWRFAPHEVDPAWLGSGSIAEGVGRIFGAQIELLETSLSKLKSRQKTLRSTSPAKI